MQACMIRSPDSCGISEYKVPDRDEIVLCRTVQYLHHTRECQITLEAEWTNCKMVGRCIPCSTPDMRSHTGGMNTLGKRAMNGTFKRKKLKEKSLHKVS